ncbi:MAG: DUF2807 domain-containing protein [Ginsengibacter sp.]
MKKTYLITIAVMTLFASCKKDSTSLTIRGSGPIASNDINLTAFQDIEIRNNCNVEVVSGTTFKATVSDYSNLIQHIKLDVVGSKLIIKTEPENIIIDDSKAKAIIYVPVGTLNSLNISGSGNINLKNQFNNITNLDISGSGNIKGEVGSTTNSLTASISGSGSIDIVNIQSQNANCNISGSGNIHVAVSNSLNATIAGSGNIFYQGTPSVTKSINGSGNAIKL